jgi:predicted TIM-barrel fold metal-dependent hydrolase
VNCDPDPRIVDAHHHFWKLSGGPLYYPWLQDPEPHEFFLGDYQALKRDYLPPDYRRDAAGHDVTKTVHVEAECSRDQQVQETAWLSELNRAYGLPSAIVAHAWFHTPNAEEVLERQSGYPLVRGIRSKPADEAMMHDPKWLAGLRRLKKYGFSWDLRVKTWELEAAAVVVRGIPDILVVLNHTGFPWDRSESGLAMWRKGMRALAACGNVCCKLSCLCLPDGPWDYESNRAVVTETIDLFGPSRCMFASNFPVDRLRVSYGTMFDDFKRMTAGFSASERSDLFGGTASRFYRL